MTITDELVRLGATITINKVKSRNIAGASKIVALLEMPGFNISTEENNTISHAISDLEREIEKQVTREWLSTKQNEELDD